MRFFAPMVITVSLLVGIVSADTSPAPKHLFILSGQSNMAHLDPEISFKPILGEALGKDNVIIVKDALSGQPIRRWYKSWKPLNGEASQGAGDLYERLLILVRDAIRDVEVGTVTFVWMQGEKDAREGHGEVYAESFNGLIEQLRSDLKRPDMNVVIGRLSDFDLDNDTYPHWTKVRDAQMAVADADPRAAWVDTDDLNGPKNRLHYTKPEGYTELGKRFAEKALAFIGESGADIPVYPKGLPVDGQTGMSAPPSRKTFSG